MKVLIVEDDAPLSRVLSIKLMKEEIESEIVYDGYEALKAVQKNAFDLVILGLVLPKVDGFEFLETFNQLKKKKGALKKVPRIVILSNFSTPESRKRVIDLGVKEFLTKSETPLSEVVKYIKKM